MFYPTNLVKYCSQKLSTYQERKQHPTKQKHFQQGEEGSEQNQEENTENSEGNIFNATHVAESVQLRHHFSPPK